MKLLNSKNYTRKIKSPLMIYVDVKNILVLEDNGKQIQMNLIRINIKTTLGPVLIIN